MPKYNLIKIQTTNTRQVEGSKSNSLEEVNDTNEGNDNCSVTGSQEEVYETQQTDLRRLFVAQQTTEKGRTRRISLEDPNNVILKTNKKAPMARLRASYKANTASKGNQSVEILTKYREKPAPFKMKDNRHSVPCHNRYAS